MSGKQTIRTTLYHMLFMTKETNPFGVLTLVAQEWRDCLENMAHIVGEGLPLRRASAIFQGRGARLKLLDMKALQQRNKMIEHAVTIGCEEMPCLREGGYRQLMLTGDIPDHHSCTPFPLRAKRDKIIVHQGEGAFQLPAWDPGGVIAY